jgi:cytochrome c-type biogenesis protein CcmF
VDAGLIGSATLWGAAAVSLIAAIVGRRRVLVIAASLGLAATVTLAVALVAHDFSLVYVAETTSLATPWPYRLAALWGGMDGSMLFYTAMTMTLGAFFLIGRTSVRVVSLVGVGLALITAFFANPFVVSDIPAVDGVGLLAILQHPAMIYHPPILYLGLTTLVIPFALLIENAVAPRSDWLARCRPWLYVSWTLLMIGMAAGANWAYVELGWGGFWAWDPVENTALMPWLAATIFLHTSRVEQSSGRLRRWSALTAGTPFALTVMGVYLTRSGATGSIHSFAEDPVVGRILLVAAALVAALVAIVALRGPKGEPWGRIGLDRDGWIVVNDLLLGAALVFITAGSAYPAFVSVFSGDTVVVDSRFFVLTVLPVAVMVAVSLTLALRRWWYGYLAGMAGAAAVVSLIVGLQPVVALMAPALASLALLGLAIIRDRPRRRVLIAHLAHLGMALFLVGVAGSALGAELTGSMRPGDRVTVAGHEVVLTELSTGETDRYVFARAVFDVDGGRLVPEIRAYEEQALPVAEPALRSTPVDDVVIAISLLFPDGATVDVSVFVRPLVWWVWIGAAVMALAGLAFLFSRAGDGEGQRRWAREGQRREGTTSGTASR